MEVLGVLEKKLADLVELAKRLKDKSEQLQEKNTALAQENVQLHERIETLETSLLNDKEELYQEKELTKLVVDGLIKSIDSLVENEHSQ